MISAVVVTQLIKILSNHEIDFGSQRAGKRNLTQTVIRFFVAAEPGQRHPLPVYRMCVGRKHTGCAIKELDLFSVIRLKQSFDIKFIRVKRDRLRFYGGLSNRCEMFGRKIFFQFITDCGLDLIQIVERTGGLNQIAELS